MMMEDKIKSEVRLANKEFDNMIHKGLVNKKIKIIHLIATEIKLIT